MLCIQVQYSVDFNIFWENKGSGPGYGYKKSYNYPKKLFSHKNSVGLTKNAKLNADFKIVERLQKKAYPEKIFEGWEHLHTVFKDGKPHNSYSFIITFL